MSGKIALVDFQSSGGAPTCSIGTKLNYAMAAGATGFVLVYMVSTPNTWVNVSGSLPSFTIPFASVPWNGGAVWKTALGTSAVTLRMKRDPDRTFGFTASSEKIRGRTGADTKLHVLFDDAFVPFSTTSTTGTLPVRVDLTIP